MATKPDMAPTKTPALNETATAIIVSLVVSLILATVLTGNPVRSAIAAYTDYSRPAK